MNLALGERARSSGEKIVPSTGPRAAGVEEDEPRQQFRLVDQVGEARCWRHVRAAFLADESEQALVGLAVVGTVADEVEHMPLAREQPVVVTPDHVTGSTQHLARSPPRLGRRARPRGAPFRRRRRGPGTLVATDAMLRIRNGGSIVSAAGACCGSDTPYEGFLPAQVCAGLGIEQRLPRESLEAPRAQAALELRCLCRAPRRRQLVRSPYAHHLEVPSTQDVSRRPASRLP